MNQLLPNQREIAVKAETRVRDPLLSPFPGCRPTAGVFASPGWFWQSKLASLSSRSIPLRLPSPLTHFIGKLSISRSGKRRDLSMRRKGEEERWRAREEMVAEQAARTEESECKFRSGSAIDKLRRWSFHLREAVDGGLIASRKEIFITSKLWVGDNHPELILPALRNTLRNLKIDYIDLFLVHWPVSSKPGKYDFPVAKEDFLPFDFAGVWGAMEECQKLGLAKAIGLSNFSCKKLGEILSIAKIPPAVNQVEVNPFWQQKKLIDFCKENGILVTAYSPLGAIGTFYGSNRVLECQILKDIADAKGKTIPQVCLRWAYEQGISVVVKSFNPDRMKQNIDIFNWELSSEDHERIRQIPQSRGVTGWPYISSIGPIKTLFELWDGEI